MTEPTPQAPPPTRLFLIRHGQAHANIEPVIAGMKGDRGLTDLGVRQAERLRDRLATSGEIQADVLVASTLPRARRTAEIVAPALGLAVTPDDDLHELRPGPAGDGLSVAEYQARYGWVPFAEDPARPCDPDGGESFVTFVARVCAALERLTTQHAGKTIAAVTHGGVIDASFIYFFGLDRGRVPAAGLHTRNTSLTLWEQAPYFGRPRWRLAFYNEAAHLAGLETPAGVNYDSAAPAHPAPPTETEEDASDPHDPRPRPA